MPKPDQPDWRKLPRKPAHRRKTQTIALRVTPAEYTALHKLAESADSSIADLIIRKVLGKSTR